MPWSLLGCRDRPFSTKMYQGFLVISRQFRNLNNSVPIQWKHGLVWQGLKQDALSLVQQIVDPDVICLTWFDLLRPINNLSVIKGPVFLGWTSTKLGTMFLLKDTTQWHWWGSKSRPLSLESSTLPLSHCAPTGMLLSIYLKKQHWHLAMLQYKTSEIIIHGLRPDFFISWFTIPTSVIFRIVEKKKSKINFLFYLPTLNIICFIEKIKFFWVSFCVFLRVTLLKVIVLSRFFRKRWNT